MESEMLDVSVSMDSVGYHVSKTLDKNNLGLNLFTSAGCGIQGAFFFTPCSDCKEDECDDEGACEWKIIGPEEWNMGCHKLLV